MNIIGKALFQSNALRVCDADKPFWYTSGTIGPFFINTHFLYKNEQEAKRLLDFIDQNKTDENFLSMLISKVIKMYEENTFFKNVIDEFYNSFKDDPDFVSCDFVSGGERRDWFFSPVIARLSDKKLLFIYKNLKVYQEGESSCITCLENKKIAHIADLINKGSSYIRSWIPAITNIKGKLTFTASLVDRNQGGKETIEKENIKVVSPVVVDKEFFLQALSQRVITKSQLKMIEDFLNEPNEYGKKFLLNNPNFLKESLFSQNKSKAQKCIIENPYNFDEDFLKQFNI